jgi:molybdopterin-containing oxidoreductase family membrane subunit
MSTVVSNVRPPLVTGNKTYHQITEDICSPTEQLPGVGWVACLLVSLGLLAFGGLAFFMTIWFGIGTWHLNRTIGWGWDITNFVWWVGIGHAGTLISAILLLFRQKWRTGVNRAAEAMTIFAVICAALFPGIHMGRMWMAFFVFPYPNTRGPLWVNFNSPLLWDVFAISTYFTVSLLFWYTGLVPDFATMRDRAKGFRKKLYNFLSMGWTGSAKHWQRWESLSLVLAGLATPLVLSVHTIVSFDFATSVIPGWHTTIFPPYFVAGAIFSGFAMVCTLMIITRVILNLEDYITIEHIESMNKVIVLTGSIVGVAYLTELFVAWYSGYIYEQYAFYNRAVGPYWWSYAAMMTCNVITPQFFWVRKFRRSIAWTFVLSIIVNIGMWFERFVIIATTLARDFVPSSWSYYTPSWVEVGVYLFTFGLFGTLYLVFIRVAPVVACAEIKSILKSSGDQYVGPQFANETGLNHSGLHHDHDEEHHDAPAVASQGHTSSDGGTATATLSDTDVDTAVDTEEEDKPDEE